MHTTSTHSRAYTLPWTHKIPNTVYTDTHTCAYTSAHAHTHTHVHTDKCHLSDTECTCRVTFSWRVEACAVWSSRLWKQTLLTTASWLQVRTCSPLSGHAIPHAIYGSGQPYLDAYPLLPRYLKHPQHVQSAADTGMPGKCF